MRKFLVLFFFLASVAQAQFYNQTQIAPTITIGTSGGTIPLLNAANAWSALQSMTLGETVSGASISLNDNSNFNTTINTGTSTGTTTIGNTAGTGSLLTINAPIAVSLGTALSKASWTTAGYGLSIPAATFNDTTTGSGGVTTEAAYAIGVSTITNTQGTANVLTNNVLLYLAAPACGSGWASCTTNYSLWANGKINVVGQASLSGGATISGNTVSINASQNSATNIQTGTTNTTLTLGGTTSGNKVNINSVGWQVGGLLYNSVTAPTINSHFNTSSDSITASNTAAFKVTVGTGTGTSTGSLTMPTASNGWACSVNDVTTPASHNVVQTASSTTGVTVTDYSRTLGTAQNFANSDVLVFLCGAF